MYFRFIDKTISKLYKENSALKGKDEKNNPLPLK
jgi:hypothetical protein